jgi:hypothetical protein
MIGPTIRYATILAEEWSNFLAAYDVHADGQYVGTVYKGSHGQHARWDGQSPADPGRHATIWWTSCTGGHYETRTDAVYAMLRHSSPKPMPHTSPAYTGPADAAPRR